MLNEYLKWVMTVPGMFITIGSLLLVIAFIMLIFAFARKKKVSKEEVSEMDNSNAISTSDTLVQNAPLPDSMQMNSQMINQEVQAPIEEVVAMPTPDMNALNTVNSQSVVPSEQLVESPVAPVMPEPVVAPTPVAFQDSVTSVNEVSTPNVFEENSVVTPIVPETVNVPSSVTYQDPVSQAPVMPQVQVINVVPKAVTVAPVTPVVPTMPEVTSTPVSTTAYGGVSPIVDLKPVEEAPHQIYGGANPLDKTQPIPAISNPAYNMPSVTEAPAVSPVPADFNQQVPVQNFGFNDNNQQNMQ